MAKRNRSNPNGGTDTRHIVRRRNLWYFQRGIPREHQAALGTKLFSRSLGTSDLKIARLRRDLLNREFESMLASLAPQVESWSPRGLTMTASYVRLHAPGEAAETFEQEAARVAAHQPTPMQVDELALAEAIERGAAVVTAADETGTLLSEAIEEHLEHLTATARPNSVAARRRALEHLRAYLGDVPVPGVTRRQLAQWIGTFPDSESLKTRRNRAGDAVAFFSWAMDVGFRLDHPAQGLRKLLREDTRGSEAKANGKVRPWTPAEVQTLLANMRDELPADDPLHGLVRLALYTGCRREELGQLRGRDAEVVDGVQVLRIRQGKSANAVRLIPVHSAVRDLVSDVAPDAFLLLMDGGVTLDGRRTHTTGDRFSRFKAAAGFPSELTFHGFRRSVAQRMETAKVPQSTTEYLLGHHRASMSYGKYSNRPDTDVLAEAIETIRYGVEGSST